MTESQLPVQAASDSLVDELIDEFVPSDVDWREAVSRHPKLALGAAAALGFWLGRSRGRTLIAGLSGLVADTVNESINEFVGRDVL